jgi:hypothetical protein
MNFWQKIGILLLLVGLAIWGYNTYKQQHPAQPAAPTTHPNMSATTGSR